MLLSKFSSLCDVLGLCILTWNRPFIHSFHSIPTLFTTKLSVTIQLRIHIYFIWNQRQHYIKAFFYSRIIFIKDNQQYFMEDAIIQRLR